MKAGGWPSILLAYAMGVLAVMSLVVMVPLRGDFLERGGLDAGQYGLLIGLIGIPAAALATFSGGLIDRFGSRIMMVAGTLMFAIANLAYTVIINPSFFFLFRLIEGVALSMVLAAGPTLIMRTTEGKRQVTAMTFWSTATPSAISIGMLLSGSFAGTAHWRTAFLIFGVVLTMTGIAGLLLPKTSSPTQIKTSLSDQARSLFLGYRQTDVVKLAIVLLFISVTGLGMNVILPAYISQTHAVSIASASGITAGANLAAIIGAFLVGLLLTRGSTPRIMLAVLAIGANVFAVAILSPATSIGAVALVFAGWSFVLGAAQAMIFAVLPRVVDPAAPGLATGVVNQIATLSTFVAPIAFLAVLGLGWQAVAVMIAAVWIAGLILFWRLRQMGSASKAGE
jgi:MFS family permease